MSIVTESLTTLEKILLVANNGDPKSIITAKKMFQEELNKPVPEAFIKKDNYSGARYIPIGIIEAQLDGYFLGDWSIQDVKVYREENEILVTLELCVINPITGSVRCLAGASSGQIGTYSVGRDVKDKLEKARLSRDMDRKIPNTLEKDFPAIKAMAVKNAAKGLGRRFGRDLNRSDVLTRNPNELSENELKLQDDIIGDLVNHNEEE